MQLVEYSKRDTVFRIIIVVIMTLCFSYAISTISVNSTVQRKVKEASPCAGLTTAECAYKLLKALPANQRKELGITEHRIQRLRKQATQERRQVNQARRQRAIQSPTSTTTPIPRQTARRNPTKSTPSPQNPPTPSPPSSQAPTPPPQPPPHSQPVIHTPTVTVPATPVTPTLTLPSICIPSC